jgi:hypothetical protein
MIHVSSFFIYSFIHPENSACEIVPKSKKMPVFAGALPGTVLKRQIV